MDDLEFLRAFENCSIPASEYGHKEHLRTAWLYLRREGWPAGGDSVRDGIKRFAAHNGVADKYHETITTFWLLLVKHAMELAPQAGNFDALVAAHPQLLDKSLLERHFSRGLLGDPTSRVGWTDPDLLPLPAV
jgi:hypothetical protein